MAVVTARIQLALDASAGPASVALFVNGALVQERRIDRRGSAELLAPTVADVLHAAGYAPREITDVIVGAGPGSFTGVRVAAAFAKGLARGSGAELHAVASLPLIAAARDDVAPGRYVAVLDALRGEWFAQWVTRHDDGRWSVDGDVERMVSDLVRERAVAGRATLVGPPIEIAQQPDARAALRIGAVTVSRDAWEPDYGRLAEAQVQWEATHARALPTA
jgi:tRNA threonylcarbamoyladenosine biosynthesis protein TsaB